MDSSYSSRLSQFPKVALGLFPTPIRRIDLHAGFGFWLKDDGLCSPIYGGNKTRKMEYLLAHLKEKGERRLIIQGATQSHTPLACALHARRAGLDVVAVLYSHGATDTGYVDPMLSGCGVRVVRTNSFLSMWLRARLIALMDGGFVMPLGCSLPVTTLGYVGAGLELADQIASGLIPEPDLLFVAFGSGGTAAGLLLGLAAAGSTCRVVAVQTVDEVIANEIKLRRLVRKTASLLTQGGGLADAAMAKLATVERRYLGGGYLAPTSAAAAAIDRCASEGLVLDPSFTGKTMAAMLDAIRAEPGKKYLFWNTHHNGANVSAAG